MVKKIFIIFSLYIVDAFFCISNLLFESERTSAYLKFFAAGYALIVVSYFLFNTRFIEKNDLRKLLFPIILIAAYLPFLLIYGENQLALSSVQYLICFAVPLVLLAITSVNQGNFWGITNYIDVIITLFFIYGLFIVKNGLLTSATVRQLEGSTNIGYQSTSYYGAYLFGLSLFAFLFCDGTEGKYRKVKKIYRLIAAILGVVIGIYGSGKGAFLLIIVYVIVLLFLYCLKYGISGKTLLIFALLPFALFVVTKIIGRFDSLQISLDRILALLGSDGELNYYTTSGRTIIYENCLKTILDSPIIGHGIYSAGPLVGQPHQMFLEVLIEGGVIYFGIWILIIWNTLKKIFYLIKYDPKNEKDYLFLFVVFLYQFIPVQFSGFYLQFGGMWFVLTFVSLRYFKFTNNYYMEEIDG